MVSARIIVIVAKNDDKRIVRYNHLPQKRRLLEVVEKWKIKRTKLNKDLRIQINEYSNEYKFVYNKCFLKCPVYFEKIEIFTKFFQLLLRLKSCPHVNRTRTQTGHRTPYPASHLIRTRAGGGKFIPVCKI